MIELGLCILGWLVYQTFILKRDKNVYDKLEEPFNFKKYALNEWDDWVFTLLAAIGLLIIAPDIFILLALNFDFMETIMWSNKIPFFIGSFGGLIFQAIYDIVKLSILKIKKKFE